MPQDLATTNRYAVCPRCGADGDLEGTCDEVEAHPRPMLRERMDCPACGYTWHELWQYHGQEVRVDS